ncbi:MAG: dTDP-4-dehydrorhamnose reductase [Acidimicrobiia bacterium]|nr:dTDP-4-dehydrorhamnose reductase [Acidimicrobiia bacterium]
MRILVTGAGGQLGSAAVARLGGREVLAADHAVLELADRERVEQVVGAFAPDVVLNCAALTDVDACERDPDLAYATNALGVRHLAVAAERLGAHVVHVSTDYVFDGSQRRPYHEWDDPAPVSEYGRSKLGGELELARHCRSWAVVRTSWVFGRRGSDFVSWVLDAHRRGELRGLVDDQTSCPTYAPDLAAALVRLAAGRLPGLFHVRNEGACSRHRFGVDVLELAGRDPSGVGTITSAELGRPAARPAYSALDDRAWRLAGLPPLRHYREALAEYLGDGGEAP